MSLASKLLLPVLLAATAVGGVGVWQRLTLGEAGTAFGSYVPWGLWVGLYVYLVGVSGGAFLIAFLHWGLGVAALRRTARYAVPIALVTLGAGLTLVLLDLGRMDRFWTLYVRTNPTSLLGWMVWVYTAYAVVLLATLAAMAADARRALKALAWVGFVLVVTFGGGEGALFGVLGAKPFWNSGILPVRFLFSAFLGGVAVVAMAVALFRRAPADADEAGFLRRLLLGLLAVNLVVEFAEVSVTLYTGVPAVLQAYREMLFGPYGWLFWVVQLGMGLVIPAVVLVSRLGACRYAGGLAAAFVAVGLAASKQNVVLPALSVPELRGLPEAFVHPRLVTTYFPSPVEWSVALGVIAAAALGFVLAVETLPFLRPINERSAR